MKIILAITILSIIGICHAVPAVSNNQDDMEELINRLQQWRQNLNDDYEGEMTPMMQRIQRASTRYNYPPAPYRGYIFGERSHRSLDSLGEKELSEGATRRGPGPNPELNGKAHPVYLNKKLDPSERNLLLYSYFNRLGPSVEKRFYNSKYDDLYEINKRNFDEIDGSAFSPFKRQIVRQH